MLQANDVFATVTKAERENPYILLGRLKAQAGLSDDRARQVLRREGFKIDELIDARVDSLPTRAFSHGFARL
jgi:hypothetical protein